MYRKHPWIIQWRAASKNIKFKIVALYYATLDPETPWQAKALAFAVVAYGLSPIDLIPDFIPFVGYLDDLIIVPFGVWFALKLVPPHIWAEAERKAAATPHIDRKLGMVGAAFMVALYALIAWFLWHTFIRTPQ